MIAHLKYQNIHKPLPIKKEQKEIVFKNVSIPAWVGDFQSFFKVEQLVTGPLFVDVERLK